MHAPAAMDSASLSPGTSTNSPADADLLPKKEENDFPSDQSRKKQKRNKPTLSCEECVERKTKVCSIDPFQTGRNDSSPWLGGDRGPFEVVICRILFLLRDAVPQVLPRRNALSSQWCQVP
jgi:hypothetical protein